MLLYNFELVSDNLGCKKSDLLLLKFADGVYFADGDFLSMSPYPDKLTFDLVTSASEVLNVPVEDLLFAFGEYWILYTADQGYGNMLELAGDSFPKFLKNSLVETRQPLQIATSRIV